LPSVGREFADSTIITIAHRLRTVIDYDRVSGIRVVPAYFEANEITDHGDGGGRNCRI